MTMLISQQKRAVTFPATALNIYCGVIFKPLLDIISSFLPIIFFIILLCFWRPKLAKKLRLRQNLSCVFGAICHFLADCARNKQKVDVTYAYINACLAKIDN